MPGPTYEDFRKEFANSLENNRDGMTEGSVAFYALNRMNPGMIPRIMDIDPRVTGDVERFLERVKRLWDVPTAGNPDVRWTPTEGV